MAKNNLADSPDSGFDNYQPDIIRGVITNNFNEVLDALNQNPLCINKQDVYGRTASMYAALGSNFEMLKWLSKREGFNPKMTDREENTMLHYAFWSGEKELIHFVFRLLYPSNRNLVFASKS